MYILHAVLNIFPKVLIRRNSATIKSLFCWWSFPLFSWPSCVIWGDIVRRNLTLVSLRSSRVKWRCFLVWMLNTKQRFWCTSECWRTCHLCDPTQNCRSSHHGIQSRCYTRCYWFTTRWLKYVPVWIVAIKERKELTYKTVIILWIWQQPSQ